jgi:hypothetical protein
MQSEFVSILCFRALIFISNFCKGEIMVFLNLQGMHPVVLSYVTSSFGFRLNTTTTKISITVGIQHTTKPDMETQEMDKPIK